MNTKQFVEKNKITIEYKMVGENPNFAVDKDWQGYHYQCVLRHGRRKLMTHFSMGLALCHEPTAEQVLDCLAMDSASIDNTQSFEEWCSDLGYDTDSMKAHKAYMACRNQSMDLFRLLGSAKYKQLLWETDRL